ncbi:hypothetical protein C0W88_20525 [Photobacterium leiognathi subsp. mandapamensis]|uniref:tetratricopeptide repeat protein n=1 Tax=Photobacterium leiognathi TaxID=553611 RepID=UPI000D166B82|nr:tetratricopeptide repeat protein [Photobacterium leiognathi]PSW59302.1 hypothetical protein C0W88_20525 [Photobacterium leiognathi subsp. mandapamensis]
MTKKSITQPSKCGFFLGLFNSVFMCVIIIIVFVTFGYFFNLALERNPMGLFGVITISGAIGGIVTSLDTDKYHELSIPLTGNLLPSGFIGHSFIGVCGAFVGVGAAILFTPLNLNIFINPDQLGIPHHNKEITKENINNILEASNILKTLIITIGLGIIGGFSGLPIISKLSNHALKKIESKVNEHNQQLEKQAETQKIQNHKLKNEQEKNKQQQQEILKQQQEIKEARDDLEYNRGMIHIANNDYKSALECFEKIEKSNAYINTPKFWINRAFAAKRTDNVSDAMSFIDKALKIAPNNIYALYNKLCYSCLLGKEDIELLKLYQKVKELNCDPDYTKIMEHIKKDKDLNKLKETDAYKRGQED